MADILSSEIWHDDLVDGSIWWPYAETGTGVDYSDLRPAKRFGTEHYLSMLVKLLPRGRIWEFLFSSDPTDPKSIFGAVLGTIAAELDRMDTAIVNGLAESVPGLANDMLPEWETELALPEPEMEDVYPTLSLRERSTAAHAKLTQHNQGLCESFFIELAAGLGVVITISGGGSIGTPFRTGGPSTPNVTRVGPYSDPADVRSRLYSVAQPWYWVCRFPATTPTGTLTVLKSYFRRLKPAQTYVDFMPN